MSFHDPFAMTTWIVLCMVVTSLSGLLILMDGLTIGKNHNVKNWFRISTGIVLALVTIGLTFWSVSVRHEAESKNLSTIVESYHGDVVQRGSTTYTIRQDDESYHCRVKRDTPTNKGTYTGHLDCRDDDLKEATPTPK